MAQRRTGLTPERIAYIKKGQAIKQKQKHIQNVKHAGTALYADGIIMFILSLTSIPYLYNNPALYGLMYISLIIAGLYCGIQCFLGWYSKKNPQVSLIIGLVIVSLMLLINIMSISILHVIVEVIVIIYITYGLKSLPKVKDYLISKSKNDTVIDDLNF